jgi:hypothetical protein
MKTREPLNQRYNFYFLESKLKKFLSRHEQVLRILQLSKRIIEFVIWRFKLFFRRKRNPLDFDQIFWVNPNNIVYCTLKEFDPFKYDGLVLDGEWDRMEKTFSELDVFIAFRNHFLDGIAWPDTQFYKNTVSVINRNVFLWGCESEQDFFERCCKLDDLFKMIKNNGYQTQKELQKGFLGINIIDEISVNLGRDGDLLFNNSAHRLAIAKLLKLNKVPIRITVCHKKCNDFSKVGKIE